ncbi:MAG TPA: MATE family efflux transporter [Steroidobacteraceae bacterium]|nr:MATE family efflux transporter [Steroidobacteraceae bacterium]
MSEPGSFSYAFPRDARAILRLGGPLLVNNVVLAGMMLANTVVAGRLGPEPLAGVAVGGSYYQMFWLFGLGVLMSMSPLVAQAYGAGRDEEVGRRFRQGIWLATMLAVPLVGALACVEPLLRWFGTEPRAIPHAAGYVYAMCFGMPAMLVFLAHRYTSEGIGWTRPVMYTAAVGLATNLAGNWLFALGGLGIPSQGARGCGIATALACWAMLATMHTYQRRHPVYRRFGLFARFERPDRRALGEILALGIPIAGSVVSEGALFAVAALLMSTLGTVTVAAHQVAISYASLMFMIPLSLHSATTIHVGHQVGRGQVRDGRNAGWSGIAMCGIVMAVSSIVILVLREPIVAAYTTDLAVRELAVWLLLFVALFQVPDGLQVGTAGALRGFKDANVPMALNFAAYWLIGFPAAWWFGIRLGAGPSGIWAGLIAGLVTCAVFLVLRYRHITRVRGAATA